MYWAFTFFAFVHRVNANMSESLGVRTLPMALFPATLNGLNRLVRLHAVFNTDQVGADATVRLIDLTLGGIPLTNATLVGNGLAPFERVSASPGIPVNNAPGGLYTIGAPHLIEVQVVTPAGIRCDLSGAWVSVDYV